MYELPSMDGVKKVIVDASVIMDGTRPLYIYEETEQKTAVDQQTLTGLLAESTPWLILNRCLNLVARIWLPEASG